MKHRLLLVLFSAAGLSSAAFGVTQVRRSVIASGALGSSAPIHSVRSTMGEPVVGGVSGAVHGVDGGYWHEPDSPTGIEEETIPEVFSLAPLAPNPARTPIEVLFDVPPRGGAVDLRVFDVAGRLVRTLQHGDAAPGRHRALWDGRDEQGNRSAFGIYVLVMKAPGYTATRKLVLAR